MYLTTIILFVLSVSGLYERGVALLQYNSSEHSPLQSVNRVSHEANDSKSRQFPLHDVSKEGSTEENAELGTTMVPILARIFVLVVDYFVNATSLNHEKPSDGTDFPAHPNLGKLPNSPRSQLPSGFNALTQSSGLKQVAGDLPASKLIGNKAESKLLVKEDERKRSDTSLLFLVEVVLVVTVSAVVLSMLLKKPSAGPGHPTLSGSKQSSGLPQYV